MLVFMLRVAGCERMMGVLIVLDSVWVEVQSWLVCSPAPGPPKREEW